MNLSELQNALREKVINFARENFQVELESIAAEVPPKTELGDLAFPVAFELVKRIKQATGEKRNPREIAERLKASLEEDEMVGRVEVAGAGYLNVFFNRAKFLTDTIKSSDKGDSAISNQRPAVEKVCVEHTSVNPNKAAHIGHVRNAVLGDTFVRILRESGKQVEIQYYIDNTGVQVADVAIGFIYLEKMNLEDIKKLDARLTSEGKTFDYYCWDLYTRVGKTYETDEALKAKRAEILHSIEEGNNETAELADYISTRNVRCIVDTMERFGIRYDLLPRESEILHLHFWQKAFEEMQRRGVIHLQTEGKNAGCWVMPFEAHSGNEEHEADKILVRSNKTVTYTGKDIAYQMWKLGLLGLDFNYKLFHTYADGKQIWTTQVEPADNSKAPVFGSNETVYNVIDTRQSYPQEIVKKGVAAIFPEKGKGASVHLSYEMVALSPAAAEELGFRISDEDKQKPFIEMSGRKGLGVKADDLLDRLEENALIQVNTREKERLEKNPDHERLSDDQKTIIAKQIAVGGLRYFLLKFTKNTVIVFDFKEALALEGETGVFCQYSAVRANSIFQKLDANDLEKSFATIAGSTPEIAEILAGENEVWSLIAQNSRLSEAISQAVAATEPAILAKYTFGLAKAFNLFYHNHRILTEENAFKRAVLIATADLTRNSLTNALAILGIEVPERM